MTGAVVGYDTLWIKYTDTDANTYVSTGDLITITCETTVTPVAAPFPSGHTFEVVLEGPNAQLASGTFGM